MCVLERGECGDQRISSALRHGSVWVRGCLWARWLQWVCKPQGRRFGGDIQQPRLPDVNSYTVTELLSNSNYEIKKGKVPVSRRTSLHFRLFVFFFFSEKPLFPSPGSIFHHCKTAHWAVWVRPFPILSFPSVTYVIKLLDPSSGTLIWKR